MGSGRYESNETWEKCRAGTRSASSRSGPSRGRRSARAGGRRGRVTTGKRSRVRCDADPVSPQPAVAVHPYLLSCADELVDATGRADVHDVRVACRRIRSVLRSCRGLWPDGDDRLVPLVERCRHLGSKLSDARDDEVAAEVLRSWARDDGWLDGDLARLLADLGLPDADETADDDVPAVGPKVIEEAVVLAADVRALASSPEVNSDQDSDDVPADPKSELGQRVASERERVLRRSRKARTPQAWHEVRKAAKRLRYTAEAHVVATGGDGDSAASRTAAAAKKVQTVLGDLRDTQQVTDRLTDSEPGPRTDRALARAVRTARELHDKVAPAVDRLRPTGS